MFSCLIELSCTVIPGHNETVGYVWLARWVGDLWVRSKSKATPTKLLRPMYNYFFYN